jgi:hypothetical protein
MVLTARVQRPTTQLFVCILYRLCTSYRSNNSQTVENGSSLQGKLDTRSTRASPRNASPLAITQTLSAIMTWNWLPGHNVQPSGFRLCGHLVVSRLQRIGNKSSSAFQPLYRHRSLRRRSICPALFWYLNLIFSQPDSQ